MQFSTGRSELNPYIAVVLGLLSLAVYVAASTTTVPKLIEGTETLMRRDLRTEAPPSAPGPSSRIAAPSQTSLGAPASMSSTSETPTSTARPLAASTFPATSFGARSSVPPPATQPPITSVGPTVTRQFGGSEFGSPELRSEPEPESRPEPRAETSGLYGTSEAPPVATAANVATTAAVTGAGVGMATASTNELGSSVVWTIVSILIGVVVFFGLLAILARLGGVDISAAIQRGLSTQRPLYDVTISQDTGPAPIPHTPPQPQEDKEVFQVGNGNLTYIEARGACEAQGAKLANYSQIEDAYNNGGEWCSYGWSEGQLALFPTQKETYEKLQEGCSGDQNACGRPGINGGYIANQNVRFAANCYGVKPKPTKEEERAVRNKIISPQDSEANRIAHLYKSADKQFKIRPFAPGEWSEEGSGTSVPGST